METFGGLCCFEYMNDINDERYRKNAAEAQRQADKVTSDSDKASWLDIASGWLVLLRGRSPIAATQGQKKSNAFNAQEQTDGTHQKKSGSSH